MVQKVNEQGTPPPSITGRAQRKPEGWVRGGGGGASNARGGTQTPVREPRDERCKGWRKQGNGGSTEEVRAGEERTRGCRHTCICSNPCRGRGRVLSLHFSSTPTRRRYSGGVPRIKCPCASFTFTLDAVYCVDNLHRFTQRAMLAGIRGVYDCADVDIAQSPTSHRSENTVSARTANQLVQTLRYDAGFTGPSWWHNPN